MPWHDKGTQNLQLEEVQGLAEDLGVENKHFKEGTTRRHTFPLWLKPLPD